MDKRIAENEKDCTNCRWFHKELYEEPCVCCEEYREWEEDGLE